MVSDSGDKEEKFWGLSRTQEFQNYWENVAALTGGVLVYNTGRSKGQLVHLLGEKEMLAVPDVCITAVGTKVRGAAVSASREGCGGGGGGGGGVGRVNSLCWNLLVLC